MGAVESGWWEDTPQVSVHGTCDKTWFGTKPNYPPQSLSICCKSKYQTTKMFSLKFALFALSLFFICTERE